MKGIRTLNYKRIEVLGRPAEDLHGYRVTLCGVLYLPEGIDNFEEHLLGAAQTAIGGGDLNAELVQVAAAVSEPLYTSAMLWIILACELATVSKDTPMRSQAY